MPIIKSARKRVKVAAKANVRNSRTRRTLRDAIKAFNAALASGNSSKIAAAQKDAVSAIDTATKKAVIHKNRAARQKASLSAKAKAAGAKPSKSNAKKTTGKKVTQKKSATKKPATKKTLPKK